jgi:hypothetical protein
VSRARLVLVAALVLAACGPPGSGATAAPPAALPPKAEGAPLERARAALRYFRGAEQRGALAWREVGPALTGMYLAGAEDLGALDLGLGPALRLRGAITILARGPGVSARCRVALRAGTETKTPPTTHERSVPPPEGVSAELDRLRFELDRAWLDKLASTPDSGGVACGIPFSFTRAQRDRLQRFSQLVAEKAGRVDVEAAQASWGEDRADFGRKETPSN